jgi:lysyl-tRNA synthetase class 2
MALTEAMLGELCTAVTGGGMVNYQDQEIDFGGPYERLSVEDAVRRYNPRLAAADLLDEALLRETCAALDIRTEKTWGVGKLLTEIFEATVEVHLVQPIFITQYPTEVSPLSRRNDENPEVTDRFELFICGREIANGFSELNDPEDQAERFRKQMENKEAGDLEAMHYDADYIRALEYGMPPTAGEGIGIDRLVMIFTDSPSIRDVLLFPYMRPEA